MKKLILCVKRSFIAILLSCSLLVTNTAAVTYQAAAIPVVYTGWEVLVTILALLGICISAAPDLEDEAADELLDAYLGWKVLKGEGQGDNDGDGEDDIFSSFDPLDWLVGDKLSIPEKDLESWQEFARSQGWTPNYEPVSDVNLYGIIPGEFCLYLSEHLNCSSTDTYVNKFVNYIYDDFVSNDYSAIFLDVQLSGNQYIEYVPISLSYDYFYREYSPTVTTPLLFKEDCSNGYQSLVMNTYVIHKKLTDSYPSNSWLYEGHSYVVPTVSSIKDIMFIVKGQIYDLNSICSIPSNITTSTDEGTRFNISDFGVPDNHFGDSITDTMNSVNGTDLSGLVESGNFDVIGGGREWDDDEQKADGDIVVPMPSPDSIADYQTGTLPYEDLMNEMGMTPIDESSGTNLLTDEFISTQTGIFSGVNKLVEFVGNIWDFLSNGLQSILNGIAEAIQNILAFLNNMISSFVQALIEMLMSLFVPSDGYFDDFFTRLNNFFSEKLGLLYVPFSLLISLLNALMESEPGSSQIYFPGIKFKDYVLVQPQYVELDLSADFPKLYTYMHLITNVILIGAVLVLLQNKLKELVKV